ncbi:MAG: hypothetical protein MUP21_07025 [Dehalococcoidia bacterium]|nr:hypothetical protein [Dehalococcoidia bacterium]
MTNDFWTGFEKRAYDYAHEVEQETNKAARNSKRTPGTKTKAGLVGAGLGAGVGTLLGSIAGSENAAFGGAIGTGLGALLGFGGGAALGGLIGVFHAMQDKLGIEEAKRIMAMDPEKRRSYLAYLAHKNEISEREANAWAMEAEKEKNQERRNRTLAALSIVGSLFGRK